jgi:hypothetical protein
MQPLSEQERITVLRILGAATQQTQGLAPRQKAALDAYLFVLGRPPLDPAEVLASARALIRTWAEVAEAAPKPLARKPSESRRRVILATLLDEPVNQSDGTEQLTPMALNAVLDSYGYR